MANTSYKIQLEDKTILEYKFNTIDYTKDELKVFFSINYKNSNSIALSEEESAIMQRMRDNQIGSIIISQGKNTLELKVAQNEVSEFSNLINSIMSQINNKYQKPDIMMLIENGINQELSEAEKSKLINEANGSSNTDNKE